jgi:UDP-glucose 4-epimerase
MKKVLITGHKGYIGQHLWKMIEQTRPDIELTGLDIASIHSNEWHDIRNPIKCATEFHTIIHLAALVRVGESVKNPTDYYQTNIDGTINMLKQIRHHNFIFASTGAASNPDSPYGFSKRVAEDIVKELSYDYTIFRFYNVVGTDGFPPTNPEGILLNLLSASKKGFNLYGDEYNTKDGTCVREYVHVNDICAAIIKAIDEPANSIENLAYGDTRTVKEIIDIYKKVNKTNFKVNVLPRRPGDLEACYLEKPSKYMVQNYSYEEMLKWKL